MGTHDTIAENVRLIRDSAETVRRAREDMAAGRRQAEASRARVAESWRIITKTRQITSMECSIEQRIPVIGHSLPPREILKKLNAVVVRTD